MTAIALGYDRRELAVVALAGGLVAPFITASSNGNHLMLFGYLTILHSGMFVLSLRKSGWELPVISFAATYAILAVFVAYTTHSFDEPAFARNMLGFAALFYLLFAAAILSVIQARDNRRFYWILAGLVSLNNFLFLHFRTAVPGPHEIRRKLRRHRTAGNRGCERRHPAADPPALRAAPASAKPAAGTDRPVPYAGRPNSVPGRDHNLMLGRRNGRGARALRPYAPPHLRSKRRRTLLSYCSECYGATSHRRHRRRNFSAAANF